MQDYRRLPYLLLVIAALATECQPVAATATGTADSAVAGCAHAGDSCDFAPGKIGVCTERVEGCAGVTSCYVCTSLH